MEQNNFSYTYSASENQEALNIRQKYLPREESDLDQLKKLDAKVKKSANVFAYLYGCISAIVMGFGMSLVMTDIGEIFGLTESMVPGIIIGVVGIGLALTTYPIYKRIVESKKRKYAPQILALSDRIVNG